MENTSASQSVSSERKSKISVQTRKRGLLKILKSKNRSFSHHHKKSTISPKEDPFSSLVLLYSKIFKIVSCLVFGVFCLHNPEKIAHWTFSNFTSDDSMAANLNILKSIAGIVMSCGILLPFSKFNGVAFISFGALIVAIFELNIKYQYVDRRFLELGLMDLLVTPFMIICFGESVAGFLICLVEDEKTKPQSSCKRLKIRDILIGILFSLFLLVCYIKIYSAEEILKNLVIMFEGPNNKFTLILLEYFILSLFMFLVVASNAMSTCIIPNLKVRSKHVDETSASGQSAEGNLDCANKKKSQTDTNTVNLAQNHGEGTLDCANKKESQTDTDMVNLAQNHGEGTLGVRMRNKGKEVHNQLEEDSRPITPTRGAGFRRKKKTQ